MFHPEPSVRADARVTDMHAIVAEGDLPQRAVAVLYDIARGLLGSSSTELLALALRHIFDVVENAQRVTVVAWPPHPVDGLLPLLPDDVLRREGIPHSPVSTSMAQHAVESREALYFLGDSDAHPRLRSAPSVLTHRIRSAVYVPLLDDRGGALGLLCVDTPRPSSPITPGDFHFLRAVGALVTAALAAERLRGEAMHQAMAARENEVRRDALANCLRIASHDLKNPLVVVQVAAQVLATSKDAGTRQQMLSQIKGAVHRSTRLIRTYLEASEALSGHPLQVRRSILDPRSLVADEVAFLASARGDAVAIENAVTCERVDADAEKLRQIFANLLSNALKFSPQGAPVRVWSEEEPQRVTFHVADEGTGMTLEDQRRLFQLFQRVGDTTAAEGTGLGLWITRSLVEAHGGSIFVTSSPGMGATFSFTIPCG